MNSLSKISFPVVFISCIRQDMKRFGSGFGFQTLKRAWKRYKLFRDIEISRREFARGEYYELHSIDDLIR